jgi:hypothetical protein
LFGRLAEDPVDSIHQHQQLDLAALHPDLSEPLQLRAKASLAVGIRQSRFLMAKVMLAKVHFETFFKRKLQKPRQMK